MNFLDLAKRIKKSSVVGDWSFKFCKRYEICSRRKIFYARRIHLKRNYKWTNRTPTKVRSDTTKRSGISSSAEEVS